MVKVCSGFLDRRRCDLMKSCGLELTRLIADIALLLCCTRLDF